MQQRTDNIISRSEKYRRDLMELIDDITQRILTAWMQRTLRSRWKSLLHALSVTTGKRREDIMFRILRELNASDTRTRCTVMSSMVHDNDIRLTVLHLVYSAVCERGVFKLIIVHRKSSTALVFADRAVVLHLSADTNEVQALRDGPAIVIALTRRYRYARWCLEGSL